MNCQKILEISKYFISIILVVNVLSWTPTTLWKVWFQKWWRNFN